MEQSKDIPRPEYPRPQLKRDNYWQNLNGLWDFQFDNTNIGIKEKWFKKEQKDIFQMKILVPFTYQSKLSGIGENEFHDIVWYRREFQLPSETLNQRIFLNCGAIDYYCNIYINGYLVGSHEGGYSSFQVDITNYVEKENLLVIRVEDPSESGEIPRGKQFWEKESKWIFYPRVTGIWQTIWIELADSQFYIEKIRLFPDIDKSQIIIEPKIYGKGYENLFLNVVVYFGQEIVSQLELNLDFVGNINKKRRDRTIVKQKENSIDKLFRTNSLNKFKLKLKIPKEKLFLWSPEKPDLYDIEIKIYDKDSGKIFDKISSYFGMRKISLSEEPKNNKVMLQNESEIESNTKLILLNDKPLYQKLFLVQGYWKDTFYTPPSVEAIKKDLVYIKKCGFNGLRSHQKRSDPLFLYFCDKMGLLVWAEIGSAFAFSIESQCRFLNQYLEMIDHDFNHPSIIVWTLLNEGWGVPGAEYDQQKIDYTLSLFHLIKSVDPTRLVIDDDGWYHTQTDICTKHFYWDPEKLPKSYEEEKNMTYPQKGYPSIYIGNYKYEGEPIIYSEVGGYVFDYFGTFKNPVGFNKSSSEEELLNKIIKLLEELNRRKKWIHGFCYTELYDQFQEVNGLLTMERIPKFSPKRLKAVLDNLFY
jgi:hypothetical protein